MRHFAFPFILILCIACVGNDLSKKPGLDREYGKDRIYGRVGELPGRKILLFGLYGDEVNLLDSATARADGSFEFVFPAGRNRGLYRIAMGISTVPGRYDQHRQELDLIWDGSTVVFQTNYAAPVDSMEIILSEENRLYYQFKKRMRFFDRKVSALNSALIQYPQEGNFYRRLERQHRRVQNRRANYIDNLVKKNEGTIFSAIARFHKLPLVNSPGSGDNLAELKREFFHNGHFSDSILLYTDLIPAKIIRYLSLYAGSQHDDEERQEEFIEAVDYIMSHAMESEEVFYFVLEYLINGFESMEMDLVADHLRDVYLLGQVCFEEGRMLNQDHLAGAENILKEGSVAPGFSFVTPGGRKVDLHEIKAQHILVVFWGTWCPHCEHVMDDLYELYSEFRAEQEDFLEVVAIGIEEDSMVWLDYIEKGGFDWINHSSLRKWDCPIARDYDLHGTPTMLLLDRDKRFIQEPLRVRTLRRFLSRRINI
jgi:thiol-disulfide isomerase/thioredoxin